MFNTPTLSPEQLREVARNLTTFLSLYKHISDAYIIEFFSENLWDTLPIRWQQVLCGLSPRQIADLLLDSTHVDRRYPSVWPLSLLAFRATAQALAFPRVAQQKPAGKMDTIPEEFLKNHSQSSLLGHIFRKHVKPKKQHEIHKLGMLVKQLCNQTNCKSVVDVGSGQNPGEGRYISNWGHLTRFLSFGLGLSVTGIEADRILVAMASKFDGQLLWALEKDKRKKSSSSQVVVPGPSPHHVAGWVNPKASWEVFIQQVNTTEYVNEGQMTPSEPSKKKLRGSVLDCEQGQAHIVPALPTTESLGCTDSDAPCTENPPQDMESASEHRSRSSSLPKHLCKNDTGEESSGCCPCAQPVYEEGVRPVEEERRRHPDFVLTGLHACGDLSATLLRHFVHCPHIRGITSVACCYMKITTKEHPTPPGLVAPPPVPALAPDMSHSEFGYPMSSWVRGLPGHQLSYKAREGACHATEDYVRRLREDSELLRTHCYRATLETVIRDERPEQRRAGIQTIKKAHLLPFTEYARLGLPRVGLPPELPLDAERVEAMLKQQGKVVVYYSLSLLLAPVVETLVLLDRMLYLQENGIGSRLVPLFDPEFSPRNFVLVALKPNIDREANCSSPP